MTPGFWIERWKNNQIGFHQHKISPGLQDHWPRLKLPQTVPVFVPLCGKSLDMLWLRARGHRVIGVEISPIAVAGFFRENDLHPTLRHQGPFERYEADGLTLLCGDFFQLAPEHLSDIGVVYDRASLVALPPDMRSDYARHLDTLLPAHVESLLVTLEYPQGEMNGPPFSVSGDEVLRLYGDRYRITRLNSADVLDENPRFQQRGLTAFKETVYRLQPRALQEVQ